MKTILAVLVSAATIAICSSEYVAELKDVPAYPLTVVAEFGTGGWSEVEPREGPKTFKERMPQVVILTTKDDEKVFRLAKKVDELVSNQEWGKWCALVISHQNAPKPSEQEWNERFAELKVKAAENKLATLSVGFWKRFPESESARHSRAHKQFDGFNGYDVAVFFRNSNRKTQYMELFNAHQIDDETLERISNQLNALVNSLPKAKSEAKRNEAP